MSAAQALRVQAHAKLNLGLRILGVRSDGYHDLAALNVALTEPHDLLVASPLAAGAGVHLSVGGPAVRDVPSDASNLAAVAAQRLLQARASHAGVEIALHKRIPAGAGLGGGSADAAAALVAVNQLCELGADATELAVIGESLGSDVPFGLASGPALMKGRGELLEPAPVPPFRALVAVPAVRCSTRDVYRAWDELGGPAGRVVGVPAALASLGEIRNDLEPAALVRYPQLGEFRTAVESECGRPALMAGSGSAYVVLYDDAETPGRAVSAVRERTGAEVFAAAIAPRVVAVG